MIPVSPIDLVGKATDVEKCAAISRLPVLVHVVPLFLSRYSLD